MRIRILALIISAVLALSLSACGGGNGSAAPDTTGPDSATLSVTGTDALTFEPDQLSTSSGKTTIELTAEGDVKHTFVVEGINSDEPLVEAAAGETTTGTLTLEPGSYTFYCNVPGHRAAGMEGSLEVS